MLQCFKQKLSPDSSLSYDNLAIAVRHGEHVAVIFERENKLAWSWYPEFLAQPIFTDLAYRKFHIKIDDPNYRKLFDSRIKLLQREISLFSASKQQTSSSASQPQTPATSSSGTFPK